MTKSGEAKERYLDIAFARFAELGFHGASLADLAKDAGVTKQALLHHFGTKERLYAEVLARLCARLCAALDAVDRPTPEARLLAYFERFAVEMIDHPLEARLVVRALLDSDPSARVWPLQPYLDRLGEISLETERWRGAAREEALASCSLLLGAVQYLAIAAPTLRGMYGDAAYEALRATFLARFRAAAQAHVAPVENPTADAAPS